MGGVHHQLASPDALPELRVLLHLDGVLGLGSIVLLLVGSSSGQLLGEVLKQRASVRDVDELHATTYAQHRHLAGERQAQQPQLEGGALGLQRPQAVMGNLVVKLGGNVERSTGDEEPRDPLQVRLPHRAIVAVGNDEGQPPGAEHRLAIGHLQLEARMR